MKSTRASSGAPVRLRLAESLGPVVGYVLWGVVVGPGRSADTIASGLVGGWLHLVFALCCHRVARLAAGRVRTAWLLLSSAGALGIVAEAAWMYQDLVVGVDPYTSTANLLFVARYLLLLLGILLIAIRREAGRFWLDAAIVTVAGLMLAWYVVLAPWWSDLAALRLTEIATLTFIVAGLMILAAAAALIQSPVEHVSAGTLLLLTVGMAFSLMENTLYGIAELRGVAIWSVSMNAVWLGAQGFMALGACWQRTIAEARGTLREAARVERWRHAVALATPYAATVFALGMLAAGLEAHALDRRLHGLIGGALLLVALVLSRQYGLLSENQRLFEQAQRAAVTDALTGLVNRLFLERSLATEVERSHRYGQPLSVLVADVDGFKRINDELGHAQGDRVLVTIARVLSQHARSADVVGRIGGDEFVVILPGTPLEGALLAAERMTTTVAQQAIEGLPLAASIGAATLQPGMTAGQLLDAADREMYRRKQAGKAAAADAAAGARLSPSEG